MNPETKQCGNCQKDFTIEADDFAFYDKIKVPPPTWCFECRQQRRYAWRNERTLYRRNCDLCSKSMVTIYSPEKPYKVYCQSCWWGDEWDTESYGTEFDFSRSFSEQFSELQHRVPRMALLSKNSVNSEYANHSGDNKNVYFGFSCFGDENVSYSTWTMQSRDCMDCSLIYEKGERLYECIDCRSSFHCQYCILVSGSTDCYYCYDVNNSSNCFLSSNLRNQHYVFMNQKYSREEYLEKIKEFDLASHAVRRALFEEFRRMVEYHAIHKYMIGERNVSSFGNMLFGCKNVTHSFEVDKGEDCTYVYGTLDLKDCMDLYHVGFKTELCYECQGSTRLYNCQFCHMCYDDSHLMYCDSCQNSQNLFGSVSVKKGEYMIFNKKYSKEEYYELKDKIIEHMKTTGEHGEFFSPAIAPVYFNETRASIYMPLSKEEVLSRGWQWEDKIPGIFGKGTINMEAVPDRIDDIGDEFKSHIYTCGICTKNYNITAEEFAFYKREIIPLPRNCPDCREKSRIAQRPLRKSWHRTCMCDKKTHVHAESPCSNEFETSYAPDRPEKVYCESCYQAEVL
ncbi:MAG: hypothetical protein V4665_02040 [Patescibacteria group bacterium]